MKYKCHVCHIVIDESDLIASNCPQCKSNLGLKDMCPRDNLTCTHEIVDKLAYCPECGEAMCPICGCHDVSQISRIRLHGRRCRIQCRESTGIKRPAPGKHLR